MSEYFPSYLSKLLGIKQVTVDLDLEGFATKDDLKLHMLIQLHLL